MLLTATGGEDLTEDGRTVERVFRGDVGRVGFLRRLRRRFVRRAGVESCIFDRCLGEHRVVETAGLGMAVVEHAAFQDVVVEYFVTEPFVGFGHGTSSIAASQCFANVDLVDASSVVAVRVAGRGDELRYGG
ncbi:MAG: hypothetical protein AAGE94_08945 [Acidobacteriota bacterium]